MVMLNPIQRNDPLALSRLLWPLHALAENHPDIRATDAGIFMRDGKQYTIPRFVFRGPSDGTPVIRIGLFALVHGDEPAGALALQQLLTRLVEHPALAAGYELAFYPVCNPTGFEDGTRHNRSGLDLNREFWRASAQPEVLILEGELRAGRFDGIVSLHADDTSDGLYGYTQGRVLNEQLLAPALRASSEVLPLNEGDIIDGFTAQDGMICDCYAGILAAPPEQSPQPFEIIFETPARAPVAQQAEAACCALLSVLGEYRGFLAQGENL